MIARHWAGLFRAEDTEEYLEHLQQGLFSELQHMVGFVSASILQREVDGNVEFLVITNWESMESIKKFAGEQPEVAVVPAHVQKMALRFDTVVRHYEVKYAA
ncbi:antibiotic biosynthesis monooxygenase family protein [Pontibacter harenae]|uniref:antibiotic biosynthesis monooxygenase family protein n=1 Tax=Pontibacter harenae TaxID=2894083 RepID=UPI001E3B37BA|nr:antibiotic biosynthesis monooxygenase [Pontibacter harenae]MCC9165612.1 antibiotic biosynthesis monooxygenase [Pontibacter harenae]